MNSGGAIGQTPAGGEPSAGDQCAGGKAPGQLVLWASRSTQNLVGELIERFGTETGCHVTMVTDVHERVASRIAAGERSELDYDGAVTLPTPISYWSTP